MMLGIMASDGKRMPPYWLRIGAKEYQDVLKEMVLPWVESNYPERNYVFQQDSAPGHKARTTQQWLKENFYNFWRHELWPPSSPDLNPLDYGIWGYIESRACAIPHPSVDALKASVEREWTAMPEGYISKVCVAFRPRLEAMVAGEGSHFEK